MSITNATCRRCRAYEWTETSHSLFVLSIVTALTKITASDSKSKFTGSKTSRITSIIMRHYSSSEKLITAAVGTESQCDVSREGQKRRSVP